MIPYGDNEPLKYLLLTLICTYKHLGLQLGLLFTRTICCIFSLLVETIPIIWLDHEIHVFLSGALFCGSDVLVVSPRQRSIATSGADLSPTTAGTSGLQNSGRRILDASLGCTARSPEVLRNVQVLNANTSIIHKNQT